MIHHQEEEQNDTKPNNMEQNDEQKINYSENEILLEINGANFLHKPDHSLNMLKNLNVKIYKNELIAVIGTVGSGKTTLIKGLLGETYLNSGNIKYSLQ